MWGCCCTDAGAEGEFTVKEQLASQSLVRTEKALADGPSESLESQPADTSTQPVDRIFEVDLDVEGEDTCGLTMDSSSDAFPIVKAVNGAAQAWNNVCPTGMEIKVHDRLLKVDNEDIVSAGIANRLDSKDRNKIKLTLKRPIEKELLLKKPGQLGITINYKKSSLGIWIATLGEGLVMSWNQANQDKAVCEDDRIIGVNGVRGDSSTIVAKLRENSDTVILTVLSYS
jgi:hypothetical protein